MNAYNKEEDLTRVLPKIRITIVAIIISIDHPCHSICWIDYGGLAKANKPGVVPPVSIHLLFLTLLTFSPKPHLASLSSPSISIFRSARTSSRAFVCSHVRRFFRKKDLNLYFLGSPQYNSLSHSNIFPCITPNIFTWLTPIYFLGSLQYIYLAHSNIFPPINIFPSLNKNPRRHFFRAWCIIVL